MRITKNIFTLKSFFVFTLIVLFFGTIGMVKKETWAASPSSITPNSINSNGLGYPPIGDVINTQLNPNQSLEKWIAGGRDSLGVWTQRGVIAVTIEGLNCQMDGCPTPQQLSNTSYNGGGAIGFTSNLLDVLFVTKPISSIQYFSLLKDNVMGITPAYAQNLEKGTNGLDAIFDIWSIFRNISYIFFVVIFVTIGFMIMFRQKIDPQTVISVENSLPKIVLALILVSISFAISGLMIDISNIATLLFANILAAYHAGALSSWLENIMGTSKNNQKTIFELLYDIGGKASKNLATGPIADTVVKISIDISRVIVGPLAELILNVAILGALFKTFFALLAAYVQIVFLTIMSPLIFLSSAVPGKGGAVSKWIKDMLANTMAFPVTFIFLFLGAIIAETPITGKPDSWQIKPPGVAFTTPWIPFGLAGFGTGGASTLIKELLAFGIVLAAPTIPGIVKEFFESKESALSAGTAQGLQSTLQRIPIIGSFLG